MDVRRRVLCVAVVERGVTHLILRLVLRDGTRMRNVVCRGDVCLVSVSYKSFLCLVENVQ